MMPIYGNGEQQPGKISIPKELPILPSGENILYPGIIIPMASEEARVIKLIDDAVGKDKLIGVFAQRPGSSGISLENLYQPGCPGP